MRILIIDKDALSCQLLQKRLNAMDFEVKCEPDKSKALKILETEDYELIILDPTPVQDARPVIINIYKTIKNRYEPQFLIISKNIDEENALAAGANDIIHKPVSPQRLERKIANMRRLKHYIDALSIEDDLPAPRGVINKDAFNELFLSAIDRSHRYGERSFVVFINIHGEQKDFEAIAEKIRHIRRQSDVIGRTCKKQFGILLQRPMYDSEPMDAITRFTEVLTQRIEDVGLSDRLSVDLCLVEVPFGRLHHHAVIGTPDEQAKA
jgi:PleD family two-component response regulator